MKKGFSNWLEKVDPDILCLQEIKIKDSDAQLQFEKIKGYHCFWACAKKPGYSGVAILSKQEPLEISTGLGIKKYDDEGRVLIAKYKDFSLFNVYFPNGKASDLRLEYKMDFYKDFLKHIEELKKKGEKIIFCGDVNTAHKEIDLARPKDNSKISGFLPKEREWIDDVVDSGYLDSFRIFNKNPNQYTWWSLRTSARKRNVGWRIDYFFIDKALKKRLVFADIMPNVQGSDHCPIYIEIKG